jgi:hypothetical protein
VKLPPGDLSEVVPPVLFPNTEVKRFSADDTEGEGPCGKYVIARRLFFTSFLKQLSPFLGVFCFRGLADCDFYLEPRGRIFLSGLFLFT